MFLPKHFFYYYWTTFLETSELGHKWECDIWFFL